MASNNRGGSSNRGGNRRRGQNNNPEGYNQYNSGWIDSARERPLATAAAVGGAVAAGVFLWSRRSQISDQIAGLSDQISEWREGTSTDSEFGSEESTSSQGFIARPNRGQRKTQSEISEEALTLKETGNQRNKTTPVG